LEELAKIERAKAEQARYQLIQQALICGSNKASCPRRGSTAM
jgi:hypothetical protein